MGDPPTPVCVLRSTHGNVWPATAPWDLGHCWAQGPCLWPLRGDRDLSEPHKPSPGGFRVSPAGRLGWWWWVPQTQVLCASGAFLSGLCVPVPVLHPSCAERRLLAAVAGLRAESSALPLVSEHVPMETEGRLGLRSHPWPGTLTVRAGSRPCLPDCGRLTAWSWGAGRGCAAGLAREGCKGWAAWRRLRTPAGPTAQCSCAQAGRGLREPTGAGWGPLSRSPDAARGSFAC